MIRDLLHAFRVQGRSAGTTAAIVLTLALGIGAVTAIFSLVDAVLFKSLGYPGAERIVVVRQTYENLRTSPNPRLQAIWDRIPVSYQNAVEWRESRVLAGLGLYREYAVTFEGAGDPEALDAAEVDAELFAVLDVEAIVGRTFTAEEVTNRENLVLLGHGLWRRLWGGDRNVVGSTIQLDGEPFTVLGVMPEGFDVAGGRDDQLWTPLRLVDADLERRDNQRLSSLARLADGTTFEEAAAELDRVAAAQAEAWPETNGDAGVKIVPLRESLVGEESRALLPVLVAAAAVVLAVACVNVAHLLLVQAHRRRGEWALRLALGASRGRLARQVLVESLVPALVGGALGLAFAFLGRDLLLAWLPVELPRAAEIPIGGRVLLFTLGASLVATLLCSLAPAWTSARLAGRGERGAPGVSGRAGFGFHEGLVVAEIALTLVLTSAAALLGHSFLRLAAVDPGFRAEGLLVQDVRLPDWSYPDEARRQAFAETLVERVGALPGVRSAALTSKLPFAGPALVAGFEIPGTEAVEGDWTQGPSASLKFVTPGYFRTLGIDVEKGRVFTDADRPESGRVLVVNETLAERGWPGVDPVGRTIVFSEREYRVVGVVSDIRHDGLGEPPGPLMYFPWKQRVDLPVQADRLTLVLEPGDGDPMDRAAPLRDVVRSIDSALPLPAATTVEAQMAESLGAPRSRAALVALLAGLALVLALIGTYAVLAFSVSRRTREIGVRMALGASASKVVAGVLGRALALTLAGVVVGLVGALAGGRLLEGLLWGVEAADPATLALTSAALVAIALVAAFPPARRASRVDPSVALREE